MLQDGPIAIWAPGVLVGSGGCLLSLALVGRAACFAHIELVGGLGREVTLYRVGSGCGRWVLAGRAQLVASREPWRPRAAMRGSTVLWFTFTPWRQSSSQAPGGARSGPRRS